MPQTDEGLDVDAPDEALGRSLGPSLVYTIPTFQNPSGRTLSEPSRRRLLEVARPAVRRSSRTTRTACSASPGETLPRLIGFLGRRRAAFLSSFSKTVAPGIRVGYAILPEEPWAPWRRSCSRTTSRR